MAKKVEARILGNGAYKRREAEQFEMEQSKRLDDKCSGRGLWVPVPYSGPFLGFSRQEQSTKMETQ